MLDAGETGAPNQDNTNEDVSGNAVGNTVEGFLRAAERAESQGDEALAMHLYLAAYDKSAGQAFGPSKPAIAGLRKAWRLACRLKERPMAEYIFEKLEPYLDPSEIPSFASQLQQLALDKLEEFGLSRDELEDMADAISQDFMGGSSPLVQFGPMDLDAFAKLLLGEDAEDESDDEEPQFDAEIVEVDDEDAGADDEGEDAPSDQALFSPEPDARAALRAFEPVVESDAAAKPDAADKPAKKLANEAKQAPSSAMTYADLAGYTGAIAAMRRFGISMDDDADFQEFVAQLNERHGLTHMPAMDALLFRSAAREDANRFMEATAGELKLPPVRMFMEENLQGAPMLCISSPQNNHPRLSALRNGFDVPGVLMLQDLDTWDVPEFLDDDDQTSSSFIAATLSRGVREVVNFIRSAVDNPDVYVLASASDGNEIAPFFLDLLSPVSVVNINLPNGEERAEIWRDIMNDHPSMAGLDLDALVAYSDGMPRFDVYMAAREAVEDAYKESLAKHEFLPITPNNVYEKLANYQPLDSEQYKQLEDAVVSQFSNELDNLDELLGGEGPVA